MNLMRIYFFTATFVLFFSSTNGQAISSGICDSCRVDSLERHKEHYVYRYLTNLVGKSGDELTKPMHFQINLPKGLLGYSVFSFNQFIFFYKKNQAVCIYFDYRKDYLIMKDTAYFPNDDQVFVFSCDKLFNIDKIKEKCSKGNILIRKRINYFINKGRATILLLNIRPKKLNYFLSKVTTFKFDINR
ncbi:MAG: hypothetical protein NTW29_19535 [Bacteroidetes bacterium]|nr:hypothetical protein [Bacteroidota bacterium]